MAEPMDTGTSQCQYGLEKEDCDKKSDKKKRSSKSPRRSKSPAGGSKSPKRKSRQMEKGNKRCQSPSESRAAKRFKEPVGVENRRRPPGPFILYFLEQLKASQRKAGKGNRCPRIICVVKEAAKSWKKMSPDQKGKYRKRYCTEFSRIKRRQGGTRRC